MNTTVVRDFEGLERLAPIWRRLQRHPNSDFEHFSLVCKQWKDFCEPFVVLVGSWDQPKAILAARLENGEFAPKFGYLQPFKLKTRRLMLIHGGLIGEVDSDAATALLGCLQSALANGECDLVEFCHYAESSPLLSNAQAMKSGRLLKDRVPSWSTHRAFGIPKTSGELLQKISSKHRSWIRRKLRDLDKDFPHAWEYKGFTKNFDLKDACDELEQVARLTYQRSLGSGFASDPQSCERLKIFYDRGILRAWTLRIHGVPRAYAIGIAYNGTFHFSATGFHPEFRDHEIGTLLFLYMVDELAKEGLATFDFGLGDASYKQRFGEQEWREASYRLYPFTAKGAFIKGVSDLTVLATQVGQEVGHRFGIINKVKTAWRKRLAKRHPQKETKADDRPTLAAPDLQSKQGELGSVVSRD
jgi:hypothetical protein